MPANMVKPGEEPIWERAKKKAADQGHAEDWPYIVSIFQKMKGNKSEAEKACATPGMKIRSQGQGRGEARGQGQGPMGVSAGLKKAFFTPAQYRGMRTPGQVPSKAAMEALKVAQTPARPMTTQRLLDHGQDARPTIESIVRGLGFSQQEENDWKAYLAQALGVANGAVLARSFMAKAKDLDPVLRLALFQRVQRYRKDHQAMTKSGPVQILRPEDIRAYNPVTDKYSPEDYAKRADVHTGGEDNAKVYLGSGIVKCLKAAGGNCGPDAFKSLVKRYGVKRVAEALRDGQKSGMVAFKKGKFSLAKPKD